MPDWLIEGAATVYLLLALAGIVSGLLWWQSRKRAYAVAFVIIGAIAAGYYLLDRFFESDREQMVRKMREIAAAISSRNIDAAFAHVSDTFNRANVNKAGFRHYADRQRASGFVADVLVWDVHVAEMDRPQRRATVECYFKVHGSFGETPPDALARIIFHRDDDGQWRVIDFDWFSSIAESHSPRPIPGWGSQ